MKPNPPISPIDHLACGKVQTSVPACEIPAWLRREQAALRKRDVAHYNKTVRAAERRLAKHPRITDFVRYQWHERFCCLGEDGYWHAVSGPPSSTSPHTFFRLLYTVIQCFNCNRHEAHKLLEAVRIRSSVQRRNEVVQYFGGRKISLQAWYDDGTLYPHDCALESEFFIQRLNANPTTTADGELQRWNEELDRERRLTRKKHCR